MTTELDPRWRWEDVSTFGQGPGTEFMKVGCNHLTPALVHSTTGELVAHLCPDCDTQLPAEWQPTT
jgi:hypothetical protein